MSVSASKLSHFAIRSYGSSTDEPSMNWQRNSCAQASSSSTAWRSSSTFVPRNGAARVMGVRWMLQAPARYAAPAVSGSIAPLLVTISKKRFPRPLLPFGVEVMKAVLRPFKGLEIEGRIAFQVASGSSKKANSSIQTCAE